MEGKITICLKNGKATFDSDFEKYFNKTISRIDDYIVIRFDKK